MKKTGELLKSKREGANLSLSEVALATKINPKVLRAIEAGESEKLPAKTFLKGFVRSYALYLKTDVEAVMTLFTEETGGPTAPAVHEAYQKPENGVAPRRGPPAEESASGIRTAAVMVIALLIGAIIGVRELIEKYQKEKVVATNDMKVSPLPEGSPAAEAAKVADAVAAAMTPKILTPAVVTASAMTEGRAVTKAAEAKREPAQEKPKVEPAKEPVAPKEPAGLKEADDTAKPVKEVAAKSPHNEVILEASGKVNVDVIVRGETKHLVLGPEDVHTIRADASLVLEVSDGGALNLIHNGVERGPAGAPGKPAQVKFP